MLAICTKIHKFSNIPGSLIKIFITIIIITQKCACHIAQYSQKKAVGLSDKFYLFQGRHLPVILKRGNL